MTCPTPSKKSHPDRKAAWRHVEGMRRDKPVSPDLRPYRCACGSWHIGHSQQHLARRIRLARKRGVA